MISDGRAVAIQPATVDRGSRRSGLSLGLCLGWGSGTIGVAILFNTTNLLLLRFITDFLGVAAGVAGLLLALSKVYDAVTDPLMGYLSDRTRARLGRRRPYLIFGGLLCAASLPMLFWLPAWITDDWKVATLVFATFFYSTAYTVFNVPYLSMASDMPLGYHQRSRLMSFRVSAIGIGQLLAGVLAPLLVASFGGGAEGFAAMSFVMGLLVLTACWTSFFATAEAPSGPETTPAPGQGLMDWQLLKDNQPFVQLLLVKTLQLIGFAVLQGSLAFFVLHGLQAGTGMLAAIFTTKTVVLIATMPVWLKISRVLGKVRTFQLAALLFSAFSLLWLLAGPGHPLALVIVQSALTGFASAGMLLIGQALLPDTIAWDRHRSGLNREGTFTGLYSTAEKIAFAIGLAVTGLVLGAAGYIEGQGDIVGTQPETAVRAIYACIAVLPGLLSLGAALMLQRYRLSEEVMQGIETGKQP